MISLSVFMLSILLLVQCKGEVFTAMSDVTKLLTTEGEMIRTVENYIQTQEQRLQKLKADVAEMERVHDLAQKSPDVFLESPINAFLLIKRLTIDWADLETILSGDTVGQKMLTNLTDMAGRLRFPDEEDLNGVALALMRIQDTYNLDTKQLALGMILGQQVSYRELAAEDCFELGRQSYNSGDYYHTMLWMNEALVRINKQSNSTIERHQILEYLAFSTYKQDNVKQALKLTLQLLEEVPEHKRALGNKVYYEEMLASQTQKRKGESDDFPISGVKEIEMDEFQIERQTYNRLCRGEGRLSPRISKKNYCFLKTGPSAYLKLAPVKAEVVHINPTITIYHGVLYDSEIENVQQLAKPKFKRATVQNYKTGQLETASYRISKSGWLRDEESPQVATINRRIGAITGLNMETAEELQVANYGIGGHYEPHFDYARREEKNAFESLGSGNRIATFLFYMSDVTLGGATVFPRLDLTLYPEKGAAAFWHNLLPNGEGDELTRHGACPVLVGQKWVSNKWIHERGQEWRRPCHASVDDIWQLTRV